MAYVAVLPGKQPELAETAERRWAALAAVRPDLAPAVTLQRQLLGLLIELGAAIEAGRLPKLSLPPRYIAAKLARGVPSFTNEPIPLPVPVLKPALLSLCDALAAGGAADAALHIREAIVKRAVTRDHGIEAEPLHDSLARPSTQVSPPLLAKV